MCSLNTENNIQQKKKYGQDKDKEKEVSILKLQTTKEEVTQARVQAKK